MSVTKSAVGKKAVFVLRNAPPRNTTNVLLLMQVVDGLIKRGFSVDIHAGKPPGRMTKQQTAIPAVRIFRYFCPNFSDDRAVGRLLNMLIVDIQILVRLIFFRRPAVFVADTTSIFAGGVVWLLNILLRVPYVYVATEVYPDAPINMGLIKKGGIIARLWGFYSRMVLKRASRVITICEPERKRVLNYMQPNDEHKVIIIPNWAEVDKIVPIPHDKNWLRAELGIKSELVLLYSGRIGRSHDMNTILQTALKLNDNPNIKFVIVSSGGRTEEIIAQGHQMNLKNVIFLPYQPQEKLNHLLSSGDLSLVSLIPPIFTVPSRIYPAMAAGQPVVAVASPESGLGQFVDSESFGFRVDNGDVDKLADKLIELTEKPDEIAKMGLRAREIVEQRHSSTRCVPEYVKLIEGVCT